MIRHLGQNAFYIGCDDAGLDLFESQYIVPQGMAYNSYLIKDSKTAILDTSDTRTADDWKKNLLEALDGAKPDYLIVHHVEPDHSALIAWVMENFPGVTLVASAAALRMIPQFFDGISLEGRTLAVKEGDVLELGGHSLRFIGAWPRWCTGRK